MCVDSMFIHSSVDEHLGGFHFLAIANSAATNTGVQVSLGPCFLLDMYLGVTFLGNMVILRLIIWGTDKPFPEGMRYFTCPGAKGASVV